MKCSRLLLAASLLAMTPGVVYAEKARISDFAAQRDDQQLLVSFRLVEAFDDEKRERVNSGLPTGFSYQLRLERPRRWWFDQTVQGSDLEVVAMFNAVTREYLVNYKLDGRLIDSRILTTEMELEDAITIFHELPVFELADRPQERLRIRVRAILGSSTVLWLIPTEKETPWLESERFRSSQSEIREKR